MPGKRKGIHDISPRMRKAMFEALAAEARSEGKTLSEYMRAWWKEDWKKAADMLARFVPQQKEIAVNASLEDVLNGIGTGEDIDFGSADDPALEEEPAELRH